MTSELSRIDLYQFGSVSSRRTLLVLPSAASSAAPSKKGSKASKATDGGTSAAIARVIVGDDSGVVTCLALRAGGAADVDFQTPGGARVECVSLGGAAASRERIVFSAGDVVRGLTRKGKEFFSMSAPTAEPIRHVAVDGSRLYEAGDFSFFTFDAEGSETSSATVPDRVGALTFAWPSRAGPDAPADVLVGCADRVIRLVGGGSVLAEFAVEGPVTALVGWSSTVFSRPPSDAAAAKPVASDVPAYVAAGSASAAAAPPAQPTLMGRIFGGGGITTAAAVPAASAGPSAPGSAPERTAPPLNAAAAAAVDPPELNPNDPRFFIYGTMTGAIGCIALTTTSAGARLSKVWLVSTSASPVVAIAVISQTSENAGASGAWSFSQGDGSGVGDVAVGREDGSVEVYSTANEAAATTWAALGDGGGATGHVGEGGGGAAAPPALSAQARLPESVRSVAAVPSLGGGNGCDILVLSFSGRLSLLRLTPANDEDAAAGRLAQLESLSADIARLKIEVDSAVAAAADAVIAKEMGGNADAAALLPSHFYPMAHRLEATHAWTLDPSDASYLLTVELPVPIHSLLVTTSCKVDAPDPETQALPLLPRVQTRGGSGGGCDSDVTWGLQRARTPATPNGASTPDSVLSIAPPPLSAEEAYSGSCAPVETNARARAPVCAFTVRVAGVRGGGAVSSRVSLRLRPIEGLPGELTAIVSTDATPSTALAFTVPIKGLALHERLVDATPAQIESLLHEQWSRALERARTTTSVNAMANKSASVSSTPAGSADSSVAAKDDDASASHAQPSSARSAGLPALTPLAESAAAALAAVRAESGATSAAAALTTDSHAAALGAVELLSPLSTAPPGVLPSSFPLSTLVVVGPFTLADAHRWIASVLPDVPARPPPAPPASAAPSTTSAAAARSAVAPPDAGSSVMPSDADGVANTTLAAAVAAGDAVAFSFRNAVLGSHLFITYSNGVISASSDSPSSLVVLSESFSARATAARIKLASSTARVAPGATRHVLGLAHGRLAAALAAPARAELVHAIRELVSAADGAAADADAVSLHPRFKDVLLNAQTIAAEARDAPGVAQLLAGLVADNFVDAHRLRTGRDVTQRVGALMALLGRGSADANAGTGPAVCPYLEPTGPEAAAAYMEK